jgi:uncharacterized membrane protein
MDSKKLMLLGILVIAACGAFVYLDPMDLDLLGLKQTSAVAKPAAKPHAPTPVAKPPVIMPKPAAVPTQTEAPAAVPPMTLSPAPAATPSVATPKAKGAPIQVKTPAGETTATSSSTTSSSPATPPPVAEAVQPPQPPIKLSKAAKSASKPATDKPARPKNQDLRFCLDLETDAAIAKCAGE